MKKLIAFLTILCLIAGICALSLAEADSNACDLPEAGLRFLPPEAYRNAAGQIATDGAMKLTPEGDVYYAYWVYCAMTEDELNKALADFTGSTPINAARLFLVFSVGGGQDIDYLRSIINMELPPERVRELGKAGDHSFYLYFDGVNDDFAADAGEAYADEYTALAGMTDEIAAAFTCYEPVAAPDPYEAAAGVKAEFTALDLDGNPVSSADLFAQNEITMVNLWATWCPPCIGELQELQAIDQRLKEKNCGIIGILLDEDLDTARQLIADNGVAYPVVQAPENVNALFYSEYIPTSYFVNSEGIIIGRPVIGADITAYEPRIDELLGK